MDGSFDWVGVCLFLVILAGLVALARRLPNRGLFLALKAILVLLVVMLVAVAAWNTLVAGRT